MKNLQEIPSLGDQDRKLSTKITLFIPRRNINKESRTVGAKILINIPRYSIFGLIT